MDVGRVDYAGQAGQANPTAQELPESLKATYEEAALKVYGQLPCAQRPWSEWPPLLMHNEINKTLPTWRQGDCLTHTFSHQGKEIRLVIPRNGGRPQNHFYVASHEMPTFGVAPKRTSMLGPFPLDPEATHEKLAANAVKRSDGKIEKVIVDASKDEPGTFRFYVVCPERKRGDPAYFSLEKDINAAVTQETCLVYVIFINGPKGWTDYFRDNKAQDQFRSLFQDPPSAVSSSGGGQGRFVSGGFQRSSRIAGGPNSERANARPRRAGSGPEGDL